MDVCGAAVESTHRKLTEDEKQKLEKDSETISDYKKNKLEKDAKKNWDLFYKRNTTKFFKDRHWTKREFEELCGKEESNEKLVILEVGCGVGNFLFPLLEEDVDQQFFFYACDFSPRAVEFVKKNPLYDTSRCHAFTCDVTQDEISREVPSESVDIATLIFVLSAISPEKMTAAIENLYTVMKPGGMVLFRDYGLYDHAMMRFAPGHKISEHFYVRQDGTRAYYFTDDEVSDFFCRCGFEVVSNQYVYRKTVNKKEGIDAERIFVQAKFRKTGLTDKDTSNPRINLHPQTNEVECVSNENRLVEEMNLCGIKEQNDSDSKCNASEKVVFSNSGCSENLIISEVKSKAIEEKFRHDYQCDG